MRSSARSLFFAVAFSMVAVAFIITGAHAAQLRTAPIKMVVEETPTHTATLTATPTATFTVTPVSTPTETLTPTPIPTPNEFVIEVPVIHPEYAGMCASYWYSFTNNRGYEAYLTLNVNDPAYSTNWGEWHPTFPQSGYYRVEAYVPYHPPIDWECPEKTIIFDTADARYTIHHANGFTLITGTQKLLSNQWLPLGEYLFNAGSSGFVTLTDLNTEEHLTATISFSAIRFTWLRLPPESINLPLINKLPPAIITSTVGIQNAPAFDRCHLPSVEKMQTWWNSSPYRITNVYIGGGLLYHECTVPDSYWIEAVRDQGWGMIPTWIGPQAPCSDYRVRMSSDPATAFQQGKAEAEAASFAASQIGLTGEGLGGTVIYYDVENFNPATTACRVAVKSFISGWTERLHELGNRAGAYGGGCTSYVRDWAEVVYPPDNVWIAAWNYNHYRDNVPLFGITCVPDNFWPNHQRIRQYTGGHNETWGGVTINIDSNIADAEVVIPDNVKNLPEHPIYMSANEPEIADYQITSNTHEQSWLIVEGILYKSMRNGEDWQPIRTVPDSLAIRKVFFIDELQGWLLTSRNEGFYQLFSTSDGGATWTELASVPVELGWSPLAFQFLNSHHGWLVVKKLTRSIFSMGRLLTTVDGGVTWQSMELPIGESARFMNRDLGWLTGGVSGDEFYQTTDGGHKWQSVNLPLEKGTHHKIMLPVFTDSKNGILPVISADRDVYQLDVYITSDGGTTWHWNHTITDIPKGLSRLYFATPWIGWGESYTGTCRSTNNGRDCVLQTLLWKTQDGGKTWTEIESP